VWDDVPVHAEFFDAAPAVQLTDCHPGTLPPRQCIVSLEPTRLILTALKRSESEDRLLMRFYNADRTTVTATIRFGIRAIEAHKATASEEALEQLELSRDGTVCTFEVGPAEIVTMLLRLEVPSPGSG
jgi:alpha-mannosidase